MIWIPLSGNNKNLDQVSLFLYFFFFILYNGIGNNISNNFVRVTLDHKLSSNLLVQCLAHKPSTNVIMYYICIYNYKLYTIQFIHFVVY